MKQSIRRDPENGLQATSGRSEKVAEKLQGSRKKGETGKAQVSKLSGMGDSTGELVKSNSETSKEVLQEMGKVGGEGGKQIEKKARLSENTLESPKKHAKELERMHWVNAITLVEEPIFKFEVVIKTFKVGLPSEHGLRKSLSGKPITSLRQLMDRVDKYKRIKDDQQQGKGKVKVIPQEMRDFKSDRYSNNQSRRDYAGQLGSTNAQAVNIVF